MLLVRSYSLLFSGQFSCSLQFIDHNLNFTFTETVIITELDRNGPKYRIELDCVGRALLQ